MNHSTKTALPMKSSKHQSGVGMVEVLVALVVMSVGMLGIASLYVTTLQAKTTSLSRMKAVNLAYDIADRIRANSAAGAAYVLATSTVTTATNCYAADCTAAQMAASDLNQWHNMVTNPVTGLPGNVSRTITRTAATGTMPEFFIITLNWTEVSSGPLSFALQVRV